MVLRDYFQLLLIIGTGVGEGWLELCSWGKSNQDLLYTEFALQPLYRLSGTEVLRLKL